MSATGCWRLMTSGTRFSATTGAVGGSMSDEEPYDVHVWSVPPPDPLVVGRELGADGGRRTVAGVHRRRRRKRPQSRADRAEDGVEVAVRTAGRPRAAGEQGVAAEEQLLGRHREADRPRGVPRC